jgi:uncharacterized protein (DUF2164 family)
MAIRVSKETKQQLVESIKRFFAEEMDEEIGDLRASLLLEFCLKEVGPIVYNRAISDAQSYLQDRVADIDGSCYEPEFSYWKR